MKYIYCFIFFLGIFPYFVYAAAVADPDRSGSLPVMPLPKGMIDGKEVVYKATGHSVMPFIPEGSRFKDRYIHCGYWEEEKSSPKVAAGGGDPSKEKSIKRYSVNLMWIFNVQDAEARFIFPGSEADVREKLILKLAEWAEKNPDATEINFFYDSGLCSAEAIRDTRTLFEDIDKSASDRVTFRDIRALTLVKEYPEIFDPCIPVYYRTDLARAIAAREDIKNNRVDTFVFSAVRLPARKRDEVFTLEAQGIIHTKGLGLIRTSSVSGSLCLENGFFILSNSFETMLHAHEHCIVNAGINRALWAIDHKGWYARDHLVPQDEAADPSFKAMTEAVFDSYTFLFLYHAYISGTLVFPREIKKDLLTRHIFDPQTLLCPFYVPKELLDKLEKMEDGNLFNDFVMEYGLYDPKSAYNKLAVSRVSYNAAGKGNDPEAYTYK
jgi:hypothetical protein